MMSFIYWIKKFFTLKWNQVDWHQVTATFEKYPDGFTSDSAITRLFYDGKLVDTIKIPHNYLADYSISVWFDPKNNLPFLGEPDKT